METDFAKVLSFMNLLRRCLSGYSEGNVLISAAK